MNEKPMLNTEQRTTENAKYGSYYTEQGVTAKYRIRNICLYSGICDWFDIEQIGNQMVTRVKQGTCYLSHIARGMCY